LLPAYSTTEYRLLPEDQFTGIPFSVYGTKLAIINFQPDDVQVFIIDEPNIAEAFTVSFFALWNTCKEPSRPTGDT
jgi:hypothetical protein